MLTDIKYAIRVLLKKPGPTIVAVLMLAIAIGVNTSIFGLSNALLLQSAPGIPEPDRIVQIGRSYRGSGFDTLSYPDFLDYRKESSSFEGLSAFTSASFHLSVNGSTERIRGAVVSGNFFDVLHIKTALGRTFLAEEDGALNAHPVAVISHALWQRKFGRSSDIVGKSVILNGQLFTIIGISDQAFTGIELGREMDIWVPMAMLGVTTSGLGEAQASFQNRDAVWHHALGRLKPGVTLEQAQADIDTIATRLAERHPNSNEDRGARLVPGVGLDPGSRTSITNLMGVLGIVVIMILLIACANVANIQLAQAAIRYREVGIRLALGARGGHIIRQLLTESILIALVAGALGMLLYYWCSDLLLLLSPREATGMDISLHTDIRVVLFAVAVSLIAGILAGLAPALQSRRPDLIPALKDSAPQGGSNRSRLRNAFVIAQVALSLLLLVAAGLFVRTLQHALRLDPGFKTQSVLAASVDVGLQGYSEEKGQRFVEALEERVRSLPGVEAAGMAAMMPFSQMTFGAPMEAGDRPSGQENQLQVNFNIVTPDLFKALSLPIIQGRPFSADDRPGTPQVVILDEATAKRLWPNGNAVGQRVRLPNMNGMRELQVLGVVKNARYRSLLSSGERTVYLPYAQNYMPWMTLHVRTSGRPEGLVNALRSEVAAIDKDLPLYNVLTLAEQLERSIWQQKFSAMLMSLFGILALVLAALGIYGVMSYFVAQRTREIGVRIALGAQQRNVLQLVLAQGGKLLLIGLALGFALSLVLTRFLASQLFEISYTDPLTFAGVFALLSVVALIACYIPARRATQVDPIEALRYE